MRIDSPPPRTASAGSTGRIERQTFEDKQRAGAQPAVGASGADQAILSPLAQDILAARRALEATDEVRADKVAQMRQKIANGTFKVDAELVVDRILDGEL
ncbi:flagellar biosynthesis anti-sigma factor FlgM [bacterium]|nr:flagellar biosynthesis anti-sigma factor FlgM [bacterium]